MTKMPLHTAFRLSVTTLAALVVALLALAVAQSPASAQQGGSCDNLLVLVDKEHRLPSDYVPQDLVYVSSYGVSDLGEGELLRQEAAANLSQMVWAASYYGGVELVITDGWRSYQTQQQLYSYWESVYGPGAGGVSAPPGSSMHQLGTTVDFTNAYAGYGLNYYFGYSNAYYWLLNYARYYGFVLTYPPGYEWQTGFAWEPWQWRYVGVQNAVDIVNSGMTLQGDLEQNGVLPHC